LTRGEQSDTNSPIEEITMPILPNARHERFAQELAAGKSASAAYIAAGFNPHDGNAARLSGNERVRERVAELLKEAADKNGVTIERIVAELAKIGFSDIRKAVRWKSSLIQEEDTPDGGDVLVIKNIVTNTVEIIGSDEIDDATAAAISEISQNEKGGVKIKLHDKRAALVDLGKHLGMFPNKVEHTGKDGGPIQISTKQQRDAAVAAALRADT
jgi:phage terminase small subunit